MRRSTCPGSVSSVRAAVVGDDADLLESIHAEAEAIPGFYAVVYDDTGPIVVVERGAVDPWMNKLRGTRIRVAPSCVPESLIDAVAEALENLDLRDGGTASSAYDVTLDALVVRSTVDGGDILHLVAQRFPEADEAVANGILRISQVGAGGPTRN